MDLKAKNILLVRGLAREERHWGQFPAILKEKLPGLNLHFLELPGVGKKANNEAHSHISDYTNELRREWLELKEKHEGPWGIIAISMGGMIALDWVDRFPYDFKKIILINTSAANLSSPLRRLQPEVFNHFLKIIKTRNAKQRETEILKMICNHDPEAHIEEWTHLAQKHPYKEINVIKQLGAAFSFKAPKALNLPGLVLSSTQDRMVHYSCSKKIAKRYNWPIQLHKTAGHDLTTDDPKWVITEIKQDYENS